jgi:hypothetical protein
MKNKKLIGLACVLALALVGILGVAGFAAASDGNANTSDTGVLSDKGALTISASGTGTITDASGNEVDIPMIDVSDISKLEGSGWITVSTNGTIVDASGNEIDMPSSGVLVLDSSAVTETIPTK